MKNFIELTDVTTNREITTCFSVRSITSFCPSIRIDDTSKTEIRTDDDFFIVKEDYNTVKLMISEAQK